jgi:hypothetical protein
LKNSDPIFFPGGELDLSLRQAMNKNYSDCINILQTQWYQADLDDRFAMGDQDLWGLLFPGVATYRRKIFNFNLINSHLQMVSGYQRRNRKSSICIPINTQAQKTADQMTKCLYHVHNQSGAYQIYSDAFEKGALTQGLGFVSIYKDTTNDPISGDISQYTRFHYGGILALWSHKSRETTCVRFNLETKQRSIALQVIEDNVVGGAYFHEY